jgi:hypothetical protein
VPAKLAAESSRSFPWWAIAGFAAAALLIGGGIAGMFLTRR